MPYMPMITCTPECTLSHHTATCVNARGMAVNELARAMDLFKYTTLRHLVKSPPLSIRELATPPGAFRDEYMGMDLVDNESDFSSYYRYGLQAVAVASNARAAVAEMPPPIKRPERGDMLRREPVRPEDVSAYADAMQAELAMEAEKLLGYSVMRKRMKLQNPLLAVLAHLGIEPFVGDTVQQYQAQMLAYAKNEARRMDAAEGVPPFSYSARVARWNTHTLENYSKPVPEFALDTALKIKRACPEAEFQIEELEVVPDPFLIVMLGITRRYVEVWDEPKFEAENLSSELGV